MKLGHIDLGLQKKESAFLNVEQDTLELLYSACTNKDNTQFRFAKIDSHINEYLPYLGEGAVKLYLYYAVVSHNNDGGSWYGIDTICKNLGVTDRSINNWNNQLETLGLIYRTKGGKRSRSTYVLPLSSFAVNINESRIQQIFSGLNLFTQNNQTRAFGIFESLTRIYVKNEDSNDYSVVTCICLKRVATSGKNVINPQNTFIYSCSDLLDTHIKERLNTIQTNSKLLKIDHPATLFLGSKEISICDSYFISEPIKLTSNNILDIMSQLTDSKTDLERLMCIDI